MRKVVTDYGLRITSVADSPNVGLTILPQPQPTFYFHSNRAEQWLADTNEDGNADLRGCFATQICADHFFDFYLRSSVSICVICVP